MTTRPRLRIGLLLESDMIPAWAGCVVQELTRADCADLVVWGTLRGASGQVAAATRHRGRLALALLDVVDRSLFHSGANAQAPVDARQWLAHVPGVNVQASRRASAWSVTPEQAAGFTGYTLDVLVYLGQTALEGALPSAAHFGLWFFRHEGPDDGAAPLGVLEVLERHATLSSTLRCLTPSGEEWLLKRAVSGSDHVSARRAANRHLWSLVPVVPRHLRSLHRRGPEALDDRSFTGEGPVSTGDRRTTDSATSPPPRPLGTLRLARLAIRHAGRYARTRLERALMFEQWGLLYHLGEEGVGSLELPRFKVLRPPKDRFWADPFVINWRNGYLVFIEECLDARGRGHLACFSMDEAGARTEPRPILEEPHHLSYPMVFDIDGEHYLIPESSANRTVDLYRAVEFPWRWEHHRTLLSDVFAVDTTVLHEQGRWWLFMAMAEHPKASENDALFVFHCNDLRDGEIIPHADNPVLRDARVARPAGPFFRTGSALYRPSQDCSYRYGYGLNLNVVEALSEVEYRERCVRRVAPNWSRGLLATHTLSRAARLTFADAKWLRPKLL